MYEAGNNCGRRRRRREGRRYSSEEERGTLCSLAKDLHFEKGAGCKKKGGKEREGGRHTVTKGIFCGERRNLVAATKNEERGEEEAALLPSLPPGSSFFFYYFSFCPLLKMNACLALRSSSFKLSATDSRAATAREEKSFS